MTLLLLGQRRRLPGPPPGTARYLWDVLRRKVTEHGAQDATAVLAGIHVDPSLGRVQPQHADRLLSARQTNSTITAIQPRL